MLVVVAIALQLCFSSESSADDVAPCGSVQTASDFAACIESRSPDLMKARKDLESAENAVAASKRWLNPGINNQSLFTKNQGNQTYQLQFALLQPIEFGAKREYRRLGAQASQSTAEADYLDALQSSRELGYLGLYRLAQLKNERESLKEGVETFGKLIQQYASRPRLTPEQEVSLSVFKLSKSDYQLRLIALDRDEQNFLNELKIKSGLSEDRIRAIQTPSAIKLPDLKPGNDGIETSPDVFRSRGELELAQSRYAGEKSEIFSDITIGPMVQFDADGPFKNTWYGFQINFPLPIWNQNGYGVAAASSALNGAEARHAYSLAKVRADHENLKRFYSELKKTLEAIPAQKELDEKHRRVEAQFFRGLVSSALVIEAHRSLIDFQRTRHEAEINAMKALWSIYKNEGRVEEIRL
ncbi:MAG: TolC family protein [Bdellovibrionales bacterium]|nr:TolC family protein [Bdellovibrionales bacterium]